MKEEVYTVFDVTEGKSGVLMHSKSKSGKIRTYEFRYPEFKMIKDDVDGINGKNIICPNGRKMWYKDEKIK